MTFDEAVRVRHMLDSNDIPYLVKRARWIQSVVNRSADMEHDSERTYFGEEKITREMALLIAMYCYGVQGDSETNYSDDLNDYTGYKG